MNLESGRVFIIGPGGAGKSTTGESLAEKLSYQFFDLDLLFCQRVDLIPDYVKDKGYRAYAETNSKLFKDLLAENSNKFVIATSSGFLVHENIPNIVAQNIEMLNNNGISILLLPSRSLVESMDVIIPRQLSRGFTDIEEEQERIRLAIRHPKYLNYGDIQIFSSSSPEEITELMLKELKKLGLG